ncbi:MAG: hypothetical protein ABJO27_03625 [Pseudoruegeria sp.]
MGIGSSRRCAGPACVHGQGGLVAFRILALVGVVGSSATAGEIIKGKVTHVRDVDTIEVSGLPVRLIGLDGPELDERGGKAGKRFMQGLVLHKPVQCELTGAKTYDR